MSNQPKTTDVDQAQTQLDLSHLRRESRTALELSVVAMAPWELVEPSSPG